MIEDGLYPIFLLTSINNIITIMYIGEHFISACLSQEMALIMAGAIAANRMYWCKLMQWHDATLT